MKHLFLLLILLSLSYNNKGDATNNSTESEKENINLKKETENTIGIGLLNISINGEVAFYNDSNSDKPFDVLTFNKKRDGSYKFESDYLESKMQAYSQFEGNTDEKNEQMINSGLGSIGPKLVFKVLDTTTYGYTILINEKTFETAFIKKEGRKCYNSFKEQAAQYKTRQSNQPHIITPSFLFESWKDYMTRAQYIMIKKPELYDYPNGTISPKSPLKLLSSAKVLDVKDKWAQLTSREGYLTKKINDTAWIKWHDNKKLLVVIVEYALE